MPQIIQVCPGIHGTRALSHAYANVMLRRMDQLPKLREPKQFKTWRYKPWTDSEYDDAQAARIRGLTDREIAKLLKRSVGGVQRMIGYSLKGMGAA